MNKIKIWHTNAELKDILPYGIVFIMRHDGHFREASYYGFDIRTGEPKYLCNNLRLDNRDIWIWCKREDLFRKTNLNEVIDKEEKGEQL